MIRCILYARTSHVPKGRPTFSIQSQLDDEREYARRLPGAVIVAEIADPDEKGPVLDRPGLNRVRDMARRGEFDLLIAHDMDRIARKTLLQLTLEEELSVCEVAIAYVAVNYSNDDEGRLQKGVRAVVSEYERAKILERTLRGKRRKAKEGMYPGGGRTPYGYRYDGTGALLVDPTEAATVRQMFERYVRDGASLTGIADELNGAHVPTHQRRSTWHKSTIRNMLRNETYAGVGYYNRLRTVTAYSSRRKLRPESEWIPFETPAIVDRATWDAAQARLEYSRDYIRRRPRKLFLLSGMVRCVPCDRAYSGSMNHRWRVYCDGGKQHKRIGASRLEPAVWNAVRGVLLDPGTIALGRARQAERAAEVAASGEAERGALRKRARLIEDRLESLTDVFADPSMQMGKDEFVRRRKGLLQEAASIERRLSEISADEVVPLSVAQVAGMVEFSDKVRVGIDLLTDEEKRRILQRLQVKVDVYPERIELTGLFPCLSNRPERQNVVDDNPGIPFTLDVYIPGLYTATAHSGLSR